MNQKTKRERASKSKTMEGRDMEGRDWEGEWANRSARRGENGNSHWAGSGQWHKPKWRIPSSATKPRSELAERARNGPPFGEWRPGDGLT